MNPIITAIENEIKNAVSDEISKQIQGLYKVIFELKEQVLSTKSVADDYKYFDAKEVMDILHITSDTTLSKYRKNGSVKYKRLGNGTYIYPAKQFKNGST